MEAKMSHKKDKQELICLISKERVVMSVVRGLR